MSRSLGLLAALALAGCDAGDNQPGPDGATLGEARALDEAAQMIEEGRPPAEASQPAEQAVQPEGAPQ